MKSDILVADSGSTKTDWAIGSQRFATQGINPVHQDEATIKQILTDELCPQLHHSRVGRIAFFGSGVRPDLEDRMAQLLTDVFGPAVHVEAHSDLLGAAIALHGRGQGVACILGTGANSGLYDGTRIVSNTPPLGYILGDEGSGAVLGRQFLCALYRNRLGADMQQAFEHWSGLSLPQVIDRVYRQPLANRWLASLSPFIHARLADERVSAIVVDNFRAFLRGHVKPYGRPYLPIAAVGSIGYYYKAQLQQAALAEGFTLGAVLRSPIEGLLSHLA